jgi:hypothetical protein
MGYAGNPEPSYMIPTCIADHVDRKDVIYIGYNVQYFRFILILEIRSLS